MWPLFPVKILQDISPSFSVDLIGTQSRPETFWTLSPDWWLAIATLITGMAAIISVILAYILNGRKERRTRGNAMQLTKRLINDYSELLILLLQKTNTREINGDNFEKVRALIHIICEKYDKVSMLIISKANGEQFSAIDGVFRSAQMHFANDRLDYAHFISRRDATITELKRLVNENYKILLKLDKQLASSINDEYFAVFEKNLEDEKELGSEI